MTDKAKSLLDAGWSALRVMLLYKGDRAGVWFEEVNDVYSTKARCSRESCTRATRQEGL